MRSYWCVYHVIKLRPAIIILAFLTSSLFVADDIIIFWLLFDLIFNLPHLYFFIVESLGELTGKLSKQTCAPNVH